MSAPVLGWHTAPPNTCGWCGHPIKLANHPHPRMHTQGDPLMPTTREARTLSGADIGRTIETGTRTGQLVALDATRHRVVVQLKAEGWTFGQKLDLAALVTVTGADTPTCPECRDGKHRICTNWALDPVTDDIIPCGCVDGHGHGQEAGQ